MSFQSTINITHEGDPYLTIDCGYREHAHDMAITSIYKLLCLLDFGNQKIDDDIIDHLKIGIEELRSTKSD